MNDLVSQLNGIRNLYESSRDEALLPSIQKLENQIREARNL
jgi:hypothetical protein